MLADRLKKHELKVLLTTSSGKSYIGKEIIKQIDLLSRVMSCIGVSAEDMVGIYCKNEMVGISTILSCLSYGANFTVLDTNEDVEDTKVKMVLAKIPSGLLFSEEVIDSTILTIDPTTFKVISKGWNYYTLDDVEKKQVNQTYKIVENLLTEFHKVRERSVEYPIFDITYSYDYLKCIVFHEGISKGIFNASIIKLQTVIVGIEEATKDYVAKEYDTAIMLEPFNLLYSIVNGILAPILNGIHVTISSNTDYTEIISGIRESKAQVVYLNSTALEETLTTLSKEIRLFPIIKSFQLERFFKKNLGSYVKHFVIQGRIKNRNIINRLKKKYSILYTMNEIVSFIASATYTKIPKRVWLKPRSNVSIKTFNDENTYGEISMISDDLFSAYLFDGNKEEEIDYSIKETLPLTPEGLFKTEDIALLRNGKLLIKGKAKSIFTNENGLIIETGKILLTVNRFNIVKESTIIINNNKLLLLVEPDFEYIEHSFNEPKLVEQEFIKIKNLINKKVHKHSKIEKIIWTKNPEGLYRKNYKIISKHF